jgi:hypothetical protein
MVHAVLFLKTLFFVHRRKLIMKISRRKTLVAAMSLAVFGLAACGKKKKNLKPHQPVRLPQRQQLNL